MGDILKRAALYIRVSTDEQTEYSPTAQKRILMKYARDNGYCVSPENIYVDEGFSGRKAEKRPAFMQMIAEAKRRAKPFDVILVHKFDRFARNREDSVVYKSLLKKECGVKVISVTETIEDDKFSVILEAILEAMAEYYSINLSDEVKKGMTEKALRGGLQTIAPLGYSVCGNKLIVVPHEAKIIRLIYESFINGDNYSKIANNLNDIGYKTKKGNGFDGRAVSYILQNPVYKGDIRWSPYGKTGRNFDKAGVIVSRGEHDAIVSADEWDSVQNIIGEKSALLLPLLYLNSCTVQNAAKRCTAAVKCCDAADISAENAAEREIFQKPPQKLLFWIKSNQI